MKTWSHRPAKALQSTRCRWKHQSRRDEQIQRVGGPCFAYPPCPSSLATYNMPKLASTRGCAQPSYWSSLHPPSTSSRHSAFFPLLLIIPPPVRNKALGVGMWPSSTFAAFSELWGIMRNGDEIQGELLRPPYATKINSNRFPPRLVDCVSLADMHLLFQRQ